MKIINAISMSVGLLYIIPIVLYAITKLRLHLIGFTGLIATTFISEGLKYFVIGDLSPRPLGARNCNLLNNDGNQSGRPGMPSSHSAEVAFFAAFYWRHTNNIYVRLGLAAYALAVFISRYLKQCHSVPQILVGAGLGFIIAKCANSSA